MPDKILFVYGNYAIGVSFYPDIFMIFRWLLFDFQAIKLLYIKKYRIILKKTDKFIDFDG